MKKTLLLFAAAVLAVLFAACINQVETDAETGPQGQQSYFSELSELPVIFTFDPIPVLVREDQYDTGTCSALEFFQKVQWDYTPIGHRLVPYPANRHHDIYSHLVARDSIAPLTYYPLGKAGELSGGELRLTIPEINMNYENLNIFSFSCGTGSNNESERTPGLTITRLEYRNIPLYHIVDTIKGIYYVNMDGYILHGTCNHHFKKGWNIEAYTGIGQEFTSVTLQEYNQMQTRPVTAWNGGIDKPLSLLSDNYSIETENGKPVDMLALLKALHEGKKILHTEPVAQVNGVQLFYPFVPGNLAVPKDYKPFTVIDGFITLAESDWAYTSPYNQKEDTLYGN